MNRKRDLIIFRCRNRYGITAVPKLYSSETGEDKERKIFNEMIKKKNKFKREKKIIICLIYD